MQAAVRSSRRKRNQYVQSLRDHVTDLKKRKHDGLTQNKLLKQLANLWQRLLAEVEAEVRAGVQRQMQKKVGDNLPHSTLPPLPPLVPLDSGSSSHPLIPLDSNVLPNKKGRGLSKPTRGEAGPLDLVANPKKRAAAAAAAARKQELKQQRQKATTAESPVVFVVLPPPPPSAAGQTVADGQENQVTDEIEREEPPTSTEDDVTVEGEGGCTAFELQLEDEVVPTTVILTTPEEENFNNGRNYVKIAPRRQKKQRIFLLKATDTAAKMVKGV